MQSKACDGTQRQDTCNSSHYMTCPTTITAPDQSELARKEVISFQNIGRSIKLSLILSPRFVVCSFNEENKITNVPSLLQ